MEKKRWELKKLLEAAEKELKLKPMKPMVLKKLVGYISGKEKPTRETLDKISLLVGFQDWESFKEALHGTSDGLE
ncbi:MAG: hypothetical protein ACI350_05000 [Prevotella sp.]